jgi:hypothetical protein
MPTGQARGEDSEQGPGQGSVWREVSDSVGQNRSTRRMATDDRGQAIEGHP